MPDALPKATLGNRVLSFQGRVRSLNVMDEKHCDMGIEFTDVTPEQYEALEEYLQLRANG